MTETEKQPNEIEAFLSALEAGQVVEKLKTIVDIAPQWKAAIADEDGRPPRFCYSPKFVKYFPLFYNDNPEAKYQKHAYSNSCFGKAAKALEAIQFLKSIQHINYKDGTTDINKSMQQVINAFQTLLRLRYQIKEVEEQSKGEHCFGAPSLRIKPRLTEAAICIERSILENHTQTLTVAALEKVKKTDWTLLALSQIIGIQNQFSDELPEVGLQGGEKLGASKPLWDGIEAEQGGYSEENLVATVQSTYHFLENLRDVGVLQYQPDSTNTDYPKYQLAASIPLSPFFDDQQDIANYQNVKTREELSRAAQEIFQAIKDQLGIVTKLDLQKQAEREEQYAEGLEDLQWCIWHINYPSGAAFIYSSTPNWSSSVQVTLNKHEVATNFLDVRSLDLQQVFPPISEDEYAAHAAQIAGRGGRIELHIPNPWDVEKLRKQGVNIPTVAAAKEFFGKTQ